MALKKCSKNNRKGFKWGDNGTCYVYTSGNDRSRDMAKSKAIKEAIERGKIKEEQSEDETPQEKIIELQPADVEFDDELLISSVSEPAIGVGAEFFNAHTKNGDRTYHFANLDEEKRIITGPAMIPNKKIYRSDGEEEYYVYFSKETVTELSQRILQNCKVNTSIEHSMDVGDVYMVESWIVNDPEHDKANQFGFDSNSIEEGSWFVSFKCNNEDFWNKVKEGDVAGFSVEGYFIEHFKDHFQSDCKGCEKEKEEDGDIIPKEELDWVYKVLRSMLND